MRTIRENFEEAIALLKTNNVLNHIKATELVILDLKNLKNFPPWPIEILAMYQDYLVDRYQHISNVGLWNKIKGYFKSRKTKALIIDVINKCDTIKFGDGDKYIKEINLIVRKAL